MFTCTVKGVCLVLYMCTSSCWSLFLVQFKSQVTFLLVAKVRVRVSQSSLAFERTEEGASPRGGSFRGCCWWSAWVGRSPSFQLEMLLHLCPFAGRWCFCLRPAVRLRSLFCSLGPSCTHTKHTHISQSTVSFLRAEMKPSFVWATFHRVTSSNLLVEPVGVSFVAPIALCHSQATQSHQGPLDSSQVLAWRHATISHEWSPHQI